MFNKEFNKENLVLVIPFLLEESLAARERQLAIRAAAEQGQLIDPADRRRGQAKDDEAKPAGRPKAKSRGYEKTHKPLGAPTLRRDPTAPEKLVVVESWEKRAKDEGCRVPDLPPRLKRELEVTWS